jgi:hypothetical protein
MGKSDNEYAEGKTYLIAANCFYGRPVSDEPFDPYKISADPKLTKMPPDPRHPELSFALRPGSPCSSSGVAIPNNGGMDCLGNPIPAEHPDRGALKSKGIR